MGKEVESNRLNKLKDHIAGLTLEEKDKLLQASLEYVFELEKILDGVMKIAEAMKGLEDAATKVERWERDSSSAGV